MSLALTCVTPQWGEKINNHYLAQEDQRFPELSLADSAYVPSLTALLASRTDPIVLSKGQEGDTLGLGAEGESKTQFAALDHLLTMSAIQSSASLTRTRKGLNHKGCIVGLQHRTKVETQLHPG